MADLEAVVRGSNVATRRFRPYMGSFSKFPSNVCAECLTFRDPDKLCACRYRVLRASSGWAYKLEQAATDAALEQCKEAP